MRFLIVSIFAFANIHAATYCVRDGGNGASPTQWGGGEYDQITTALAAASRGDIILVADGTYLGFTFNEAASSTTTVVVRKAVTANAGGITGWQPSYGDGQAVIGDVFIDTPYFVFDGVTRTETTRMEEPAGYGFRVSGIDASGFSGRDATGSLISYVDAGGTWSTATTPNCTEPAQAIYFPLQENVTFTRCVFHNAGINGALAMIHGSTDLTFDHCDFYQGWGKATVASPNAASVRTTVKYCRFWNSSRKDEVCEPVGSGITVEVGSYTTGIGSEHVGHLIYGNVVFGDTAGGRFASIGFGDGTAGSGEAVDCKIYNNTFVGFPETCTGAIIFLYSGSGNEARNNLAYDITGSFTITANTTSNNALSMTDPFVDSANLDFRLAEHTASGFTLGSPFDVDPDGVARGSDGNWDLGAYQFDGSTPPSSGAPNAFGYTARVGNVRAP